MRLQILPVIAGAVGPAPNAIPFGTYQALVGDSSMNLTVLDTDRMIVTLSTTSVNLSGADAGPITRLTLAEFTYSVMIVDSATGLVPLNVTGNVPDALTHLRNISGITESSTIPMFYNPVNNTILVGRLVARLSTPQLPDTTAVASDLIDSTVDKAAEQLEPLTTSLNETFVSDVAPNTVGDSCTCPGVAITRSDTNDQVEDCSPTHHDQDSRDSPPEDSSLTKIPEYTDTPSPADDSHRLVDSPITSLTSAMDSLAVSGELTDQMSLNSHPSSDAMLGDDTSVEAQSHDPAVNQPGEAAESESAVEVEKTASESVQV
jgi:hypothetical protein